MWEEKMNNLFELVKKHWLCCAIGAVGAILLLWQFGFWEWLWGWLNASDVVDERAAAAVSRNRGGAVLAIIGLAFLAWGRLNLHRQTEYEKKQVELSEKTSLHERYEKAARMLSDEVMSVRIAGCRALLALAKDDKSMSMLSPCSGLLFSYIKEPYFAKGEEDKRQEMIDVKGDFAPDKELRTDIQEAINVVSAIYQYAYDEGADLTDKIISLPSYFWQNQKREHLCFAHGDFENQDMQKANLYGANLQKTNLMWAKLQKANLIRADLQSANLLNADITNASLVNAQGLTKEQILSAWWGIDKERVGKPPSIFGQLMEDEDIKKWCKMPDYEFTNGEVMLNGKKIEWRESLKSRGG